MKADSLRRRGGRVERDGTRQLANLENALPFARAAMAIASLADTRSTAGAARGFRFDLIHDPNLSRLAKRVGLLAKILFCQCVDMRGGTGFNRARNAAADLHVAIGIVRVDDCERDRRARF